MEAAGDCVVVPNAVVGSDLVSAVAGDCWDTVNGGDVAGFGTVSEFGEFF